MLPTSVFQVALSPFLRESTDSRELLHASSSLESLRNALRSAVQAVGQFHDVLQREVEWLTRPKKRSHSASKGPSSRRYSRTEGQLRLMNKPSVDVTRSGVGGSPRWGFPDRVPTSLQLWFQRLLKEQRIVVSLLEALKKVSL